MSWCVTLESDGDAVEVENHAEGCIVTVDGSTRADLNVTYNYSPLYRLACGHNLMKWLDGKKASDTQGLLNEVVLCLGSTADYLREDQSKGNQAGYWTPTPGNAGYAAKILLDWATANPDAVWSVR